MRLITTLLLLISVNAFAQLQGALENPSNESFTSGIYMFSGWVCEAEEVEIVINGSSGLKAAYGTSRGDTAGICGDSNNGFGLLYNMALLGTGEHTAVAYADGQEFGRSTFSVQRLSTGEFLRGTQHIAWGNNFPTAYQEVFLGWIESAQNYAILAEGPSPDPFSVQGIWYSDSDDYAFNISVDRLYADRMELYSIGAPVSPYSSVVAEASAGYLRVDTAKMYSVLPESVEVEYTVKFVDPLNAIATMDKCVSYDSNIACRFSPGATISLRKLVGPNTSFDAVDDGTTLTPIGEFLGEAISDE